MVAFVPGENMVYFTGLHFHLSERPILGLYSRDGLSFIIPDLEVAKLEARPELEARRFSLDAIKAGYDGSFQRMLSAALVARRRHLRAGRADPAFLRMARAGRVLACRRPTPWMSATCSWTCAPAKRRRKSPICSGPLISAKRRLQATMNWARPGMTERQIADRLGAEMLERGSHGHAFLDRADWRENRLAARQHGRPRLGRRRVPAN